MKTALLLCAAGATLWLAPAGLAETIRSAGILGNSGESGASLVRFGEKPAAGLGVVYDRFGSLWDRAGERTLNRYAADGRLLASYPLDRGGGSVGDRDALALLDDALILKLGKKLYTLPVTAPSGTAPAPLPRAATRLAQGTRDGWAVAADERSVFFVNARGETKQILDGVTPADLAVGPDGIYGYDRGNLFRLDAGADTGRALPQPAPGDRPQWLAGHWFGSANHGTIRRFSVNLTPDPGVVLGGASGSFIGHVDGNYELSFARGLAVLPGQLFACSGAEGILHLLEWRPAEVRFEILRRIGAVPACSGLALDSQGRVWFHSGVWEWSDGPDAPLRQGVPAAEAPGIAGAVMLPGDIMVAPAVRVGRKTLYHGPLTTEVKFSANVDTIPAGAVACTLVDQGKKKALLVVTPSGQGELIALNPNGQSDGPLGSAKLQTTKPLAALTSVATLGSTLLAAADGAVVEFQREGEAWKESARWTSWAATPESRFGGKIQLAAADGHLWIADTERHRVLCFDAATHRLLAAFGAADRAGSDLASLAAPGTLAANGQRAVVFDSGNQRLVKLELTR